MLGWFQRLMPHTLLFFPLCERHATTVTAAAEALRQMLKGLSTFRSIAEMSYAMKKRRMG